MPRSVFLESQSARTSAPLIRGTKSLLLLNFLVLATGLSLYISVPANAQTFSLLYTFPDPGYPQSLVDVGGMLYGTTFYGGRFGNVFRLNPATSEFAVLYSFDSILTGRYPNGLTSDGDYLYGTTREAGSFHGQGIVFKINVRTDQETKLWVFQNGGQYGILGGFPVGGLVLDQQGNVYGTTTIGPDDKGGMLFRVDPAGNETVLYTFANPYFGLYPESNLLLDAAGNLYGTTLRGGDPSCDCGTVFELDSAGNQTILHRFAGPDGSLPTAGLIQDAAGNFYGTTTTGGAYGAGTIFKLDSGGQHTVLYSFTGGTDGNEPYGGVVEDASGQIYGTAVLGGAFNNGTVFKLYPSGKLTVLHSFVGTDGANPFAPLVLDGSGVLYGTAERGGAQNNGTVFKIIP